MYSSSLTTMVPRWKNHRVYWIIVFSYVLLNFSIVSIESRRYNGGRFLERTHRMIRVGGARDEIRSKICFDLVGCFADPPPRLPIKRPPEHPDVINTRCLLFTREEHRVPEVLSYGDNSKSIGSSRFNVTKDLKVIIHGYKGSGMDAGAILGAKSFLEMEDVNVIILDWTRGAGTSYAAAVANTELVGRQLALVLLDAINLGSHPDRIHIVGFSLGAHVAGCASESLKKKGILIGRITGLDPASPFFRNHLLREKSRKLDAGDAKLVDVIHTDGSDDFVDGFGLLKPMGHIDFFPNGGMEQPGCSDVKNSVVVSHLNDEFLDRDIACSHLRAWSLFLESINSQSRECKFAAWPCARGSVAYARGTCFPLETTKWSQEMGYAADRGPMGIYYLATRSQEPFCGTPVRVVAMTSSLSRRTSGILFFNLLHGNSSTLLKIKCDLPSRRNSPSVFYNIAAVEYKSITEDTPFVTATVWYRQFSTISDTNGNSNSGTTVEPYADTILLNVIVIEDRKGSSWKFCEPNVVIGFSESTLRLSRAPCNALSSL